jgi:ceramide glucosyltransferase
MFLSWAAAFVLTILSLFFLRTVLCHLLTWRRLARSRIPPADTRLPPISIIKPVRGLDQEADLNFLSFIQSNYPAPFEVIFCVEDRRDPAVPLIRRLIANAQPPAEVRLVFSKRQDAREIGKTINLMAGIKESRYEVLVLSDSDVRNTSGFLEELARSVVDPSAGLAYAPPVYKEAKEWSAALLALGVNEAILDLALKPPSIAIASTLAVRRDVLRAIGGLAALRHRIGLDAALGRAVRSKGFQVKLISQPATIVHPHGTLHEWQQQMHRWLVILRRYRELVYFLSLFLEFPIFWATLYLLFATLQGKSSHGFALWTLILAVRLLSLTVLDLFFVKDRGSWRYFWLATILDFLKLPLWLESYLNPYVVWRGKKYRVIADATVRPVT